MARLSHSARQRPLPLLMRQDLVVRAQLWGGERRWVVKDPAAARYFHLREEEYVVLRMLDGRHSLAQIAGQFAEQFAPRRVSQAMLQQFLAGLYRDGLVVSNGAGQGAELFARRERRRAAEQRSAWLRLLAIRFRGIDPEPLLAWLYPRCRWLFTPAAMLGSLALMLTAVATLASHWPQVASELPRLSALLTAENVVPALLTLGAIKVLHELGHALTARHFGGEVRELGVMFLFFAPCLYVNVSDAWLLPDRWRRIAISAAGMYVELVLASLAALLWLHTEPGLVNSLALNVAVLTSVNTVLLNGNPLLRYDGYYILCDLVATPNLASQAFRALRLALARWCLGLSPRVGAPDNGFHPWLLLYALASFCYRALMLATLTLLAWHTLRPYGLAPLAIALAAVVAGQYAWLVLAGVVRLGRRPGIARQIDPRRALATVVVVGLVVAGLLWAPVPWSISAPASLHPRDAQTVYVSVPGRVREVLSWGSEVQTGETLAELDNFDVARDVARLRGDQQRQTRHVENLETNRGNDPAAEQQLATAREALTDLTEQLARRESELAELTLVAPRSGTLLPVAHTRENPPRGMLPRGRLRLAGRDTGLYLPVGTPLGAVGDPSQLEGVLSVEQADVDLLAVGMPVRLRLTEFPGRTLHGQVTEIAARQQELAPRPGEAEQAASSTAEPNHPWQPTVYQVRVALADLPADVRIGAQGVAKITVAGHSLAWWGARRWSSLWK